MKLVSDQKGGAVMEEFSFGAGRARRRAFFI
jgi:hypothetical protein